MDTFLFYRKLFLTSLQDVTLAAACAPPGGGRNNLTPRLVRHFAMLTIPPPSEHSLKHMFMVSIVKVLKILNPKMIHVDNRQQQNRQYEKPVVFRTAYRNNSKFWDR